MGAFARLPYDNEETLRGKFESGAIDGIEYTLRQHDIVGGLLKWDS